jgi:hypothetical protein
MKGLWQRLSGGKQDMKRGLDHVGFGAARRFPIGHVGSKIIFLLRPTGARKDATFNDAALFEIREKRIRPKGQ